MHRWVRGAVVAAFAAGLLWYEHKRSLRSVHDSKLRRDARNLAIAGLAALATQLVEIPVATAIARRAERRKTGLLQIAPMPVSIKPFAALVLLDYTLYVWHRLTHGVPLLWRFHRVHHIDREMDASTALRFHFGEILLSVAFRAAQMAIIGPTPATYENWQMFLILCILFHHSNVRLPLTWERRVATIVMTPRLHGIHHSDKAELLASNWSSGFTIWDWVHGTLRTSVPQDSIVIGVLGFRSDRDQRLGYALVHPFIEAAQIPPAQDRPSRETVYALEA